MISFHIQHKGINMRQKELINICFNPQQKMAELVSQYHIIVLLLPRFGIQLGFGDKSVEKVCDIYGVDIDLFLDICHIYAKPDYLLADKYMSNHQMEFLLSYLKLSHQYYLEEQLPHISNHINLLAAKLPPSQCRTLKDFIQKYEEEVEKHFNYEEKTVFPYIHSLLEQMQTNTYNIDTFKKNHSNINDQLDDLTNIIIKYLPGDTLQGERISVIFDLFQLADDIKKHTLIEEHILIPTVTALERRKK